MLLLQQQQQQHAKRQARERVRENRFRFKFLAVRIRFSIKNLSARPMNVYPIFLSLYVIMTMRTRVGRIAYRVSDKPRKVPPFRAAAPPRDGHVRSPHQRETRCNPRAPGSRRTVVVRILFRIDFGISAGAPETDEVRGERTRQEGKGIKKKGCVQRR